MPGSSARRTSDAGPGPDETVDRCDLCVVGAGVAGLNALFVAGRYLSREQTVILVDRRHRLGGMWVDTYPYVRLHQPHGMFTAGNITWTLGRERSYLATKPEVLDHLDHCLDVIKERVHVDELFGWSLESEDEVDGVVRVVCRAADGRRRVIETRRLIKAFGAQVVPNEPLELSSTRVRSVSPDYCDVRGDEMRADRAPIWIIGGGKTAMDTAHAVVTGYPGREVNIVAGSGTYFISRDRTLPNGFRRWVGGALLSRIGCELARRFDGVNETETAAWMRATHGTWFTPETGNFLLGLLSESENATIAAGVTDVVIDHLVDAVDRDDGVELLFRSGASRPIPAGSWIVNCTGYLVRHESPYEPYVSDSGAVMSINLRSATLHLTTYMGYFMTHLMFSDKLQQTPLYELDAFDLRRKSNAVFPYAVFTLAQYNLSLLSDALPGSAFRDCGLDPDRWYPMPRRMLAGAQFLLSHRRDREHHRQTLDTLRDRFAIRCGPLPTTPEERSATETADVG
ncbi:putative flavoprotein involved in K+ transport [Mycolicibacterium chubuense NBB4]|uniref:Putative flavoprotein involved in K+ transport n=1 Tax=Mycolicibacterium chubuense (strain NBB4) TaxID=710421 RepID=I4BEG5_MYCCN|nr:putative flavoprotein involved in K+ transport [Mycolicibacterium chubuense NBB4]